MHSILYCFDAFSTLKTKLFKWQKSPSPKSYVRFNGLRVVKSLPCLIPLNRGFTVIRYYIGGQICLRYETYTIRFRCLKAITKILRLCVYCHMSVLFTKFYLNKNIFEVKARNICSHYRFVPLPILRQNSSLIFLTLTWIKSNNKSIY